MQLLRELFNKMRKQSKPKDRYQTKYKEPSRVRNRPFHKVRQQILAGQGLPDAGIVQQDRGKSDAGKTQKHEKKHENSNGWSRQKNA